MAHRISLVLSSNEEFHEPLYDALEVGNKPYKDEAHSTTELEALTKFPRLPKPQESQGRVASPQLNWRLPANPCGYQSHKNHKYLLGIQCIKLHKIYK